MKKKEDQKARTNDLSDDPSEEEEEEGIHLNEKDQDTMELLEEEEDLSEEDIRRMLWNDPDNPWKKEAVQMSREKDQLESEVLRLQNKVMFLNGELNKLKSPPMIVGTVVAFSMSALRSSSDLS